MRCEELMLRDWVQAVCEHYEPYKIVLERGQVEFVNRGLVYPDCGGIFYDETRNDNREYEKLEPVPLTEDMLKANGFVFNNESDDLHYRSYHIGNYVVFWHTNTNDLGVLIGTSGVEIRYVHELQRILRCVGMWDLANNFNIK